MRTGWQTLQEAIASSYLGELRRHASEEKVNASRIDSDATYYDQTGNLRTSRHFVTGNPTDTLMQAHDHLQGLAEEVTGIHLWPTRCSFIYYEPHDFVGPHQDVYQCQVTLLLPLTPSSDSDLEVYEGITDTHSPEEIDASFKAGVLRPTEKFRLQPTEALAIFGSKVPHARRANADPHMTLAFCFSPLARL